MRSDVVVFPASMWAIIPILRTLFRSISGEYEMGKPTCPSARLTAVGQVAKERRWAEFTLDNRSKQGKGRYFPFLLNRAFRRLSIPAEHPVDPAQAAPPTLRYLGHPASILRK